MLEQFDYYNQKQNEVLYANMENMDFLPPTAPTSFSQARLVRPIRSATATPSWSILVAANGRMRLAVIIIILPSH